MHFCRHMAPPLPQLRIKSPSDDHSVNRKLWPELAGNSPSPWEGMPRHGRPAHVLPTQSYHVETESSRAGVLQTGTIRKSVWYLRLAESQAR